MVLERNGQLCPVGYFTIKQQAAKCNHSTIEKELFTVVQGVKMFYLYLYGDGFVIETDHMPVASLKTSKSVNAHLMGWTHYLQQFKFTVRYIKCQSNVGADFFLACYRGGKHVFVGNCSGCVVYG